MSYVCTVCVVVYTSTAYLSDKQT